jgi:hypothetical protein
VAAGLAGCGGDGDNGSPTTAAPARPPVDVSVASSDERLTARGDVPAFGARTTFRGRATRDGEPLAGARVVLRDADDDRVLARTVSDDRGHYVLRARFDRNATVRVHVDGEPGPAVDVPRGVDLGRAEVVERGDGLNEFRGIVRYPRDVEPDLRFALFVGSQDRPRLPRRPADPRVAELAPGRARVTLTFRAREAWRMQLCVAPGPDSGSSGPPGTAASGRRRTRCTATAPSGGARSARPPATAAASRLLLATRGSMLRGARPRAAVARPR